MATESPHIKAAIDKAELVPFLEELFGITAKGCDISRLATILAAVESAVYFSEHMLAATPFKGKRALLASCMAARTLDGMVLEFGVASGRSVNFLASMTEGKVYGFDSFKGLPETWRPGFQKGRFAQELPAVAANVGLQIGLFQDTLPAFLREHDERVSFLHVDCDLYSSTAFVLNTLASRIGAGTIIAFDEYLNYPGWKFHEHKAFMEFVSSAGLSYEYIALVPTSQQVAVKITAK